MALQKPVKGAKRGRKPGQAVDSLGAALDPLKQQFKQAHRKPRGKMPSWFVNLTPDLQSQVRQQAFKADPAVKAPSAEEVGLAVLAFWERKLLK